MVLANQLHVAAGKRLISLRGMVKAIAGKNTGKLGDYIGISALKPFINKDIVAGEFVDLNIPGASQYNAKCLESKQFLGICLARYIGVSALKPFINKGIVVAQLIDLNIPGASQFNAKCLESKQFLGICLARYIGVSALKPFINKDIVVAELVVVKIPGTQYDAKYQLTKIRFYVYEQLKHQFYKLICKNKPC